MRAILPLLFAFATPALAEFVTHGALVVDHLRTFETPPMARTAAAYFSIINTGDVPDALIGLTADFPRTEIHQSFEDGGIMRMRPAPRLEIAPGQTVTLAPGGYHVMLMGLDGDPFEEGETIPATLIFEHAGPLDVQFPVMDIRLKGKLTGQ